MNRGLVYTDAAEQDLVQLFNYLAAAASVEIASSYVARLTDLCESFAPFPDRGTRRDDIGPGVRTYGWRRRATVVFRVQGNELLIIGLFVNGRDVETALADRDFSA